MKETTYANKSGLFVFLVIVFLIMFMSYFPLFLQYITSDRIVNGASSRDRTELSGNHNPVCEPLHHTRHLKIVVVGWKDRTFSGEPHPQQDGQSFQLPYACLSRLTTRPSTNGSGQTKKSQIFPTDLPISIHVSIYDTNKKGENTHLKFI